MNKGNSRPGAEQRVRVEEAYRSTGGNISEIARQLGISRRTVTHHLRKSSVGKKPMVAGSIKGVEHEVMKFPKEGDVKRYILTSAQNNTRVNEKVWNNLLALRSHYSAELLIGTFSYNTNAYGKLAIKRGKEHTKDNDLWFDDRLIPFFADDRRELASGLVWCGEMNIIPTSADPLSGLDTYSGRKSSIFPHAKLQMKSIAAMKDSFGPKLMYTTGTITQRNYIKKKLGFLGEYHHIYGALLVEVDSLGRWWVRQLDADSNGTIQDLDVVVKDSNVTIGNKVEAITWGDIHATQIDPVVEAVCAGEGGMLDTLKPDFQFFHDVLNGESFNHHSAADPHAKFKSFIRGYSSTTLELQSTGYVVNKYSRTWCRSVVVDSNHDNWLMRWLREHDYRRDPINATLFLKLQAAIYQAIQSQNQSFNLTAFALIDFVSDKKIVFLKGDESFKIARGKIECGMHGHLGPDGARGTPANLNKIGRHANTGHTHSARIINGLYVAGTSSLLDCGYNKGPSSWTHSHILTYPNGKRSIVTLYDGKWRA
jgi:DNA-binding transcriptional ArsR family regulator